ncbi:MAG TPA: 16S rRNA (cytidine(1402)-2'-O)-methyltransferase [Chloroflexota bacterium]|nr:16S rRNA (cytidine(1402)-2'-O)-methyltransferase [Chloroflexota bacterium]
MSGSGGGEYRGKLFLVGTPIGNLEDITLRALRILREVPLIAAEDTRQTRKLLDRYEIQRPLVSYYEHNERARVAPLLDHLRENDLALVSEAGTPGISDPGFDLVRAAIAAGVTVVPIPGPSAPVAALAASGLPTDQFVYLGFLPRRPAERRKYLRSVAAEPRTMIAFESPNRLVATLNDIGTELGDREVVVARELTKIHEEFVRGPASRVLARFETTPPRGEITLLIAGNTAAPAPIDVDERIRVLRAAGLGNAEIAGRVSRESGVPRREIYRLLIES